MMSGRYGFKKLAMSTEVRNDNDASLLNLALHFPIECICFCQADLDRVTPPLSRPCIASTRPDAPTYIKRNRVHAT